MGMKGSLSRRSFLRRTAAAGAAWTAPMVVPGSALGRGDGAERPDRDGRDRIRRAVRARFCLTSGLRRLAVHRRVGLPGDPARRGEEDRGRPLREPGLRYLC